MVKKPLFKLMKGNAMELPIYHQQKIMAKQQSNLSYIKQSYDFKLMILKEFLEDIEQNKHKQNFDINAHYQAFYAPKFAAIGGTISGHVRNFKNYLIMELLVFMKSKYETMDLFTMKMYQTYSKEVFNSSPTQKNIIPLLNNEINLEQKLKDKKETFGHSHVSKMSWLNILGDGVNDEMKSIFNEYYNRFISQRISLKKICEEEENAVKLILKSSKDNKETKKEE